MLLCNLLTPELPQDKSLAKIIVVLQDHYEPKPVVITQPFHFHCRDQQPTESIAEYVAELNRLLVHCYFGAYLSDALHDWLFCSLRNKAIQKRLLSIKDLTFKDCEDTIFGCILLISLSIFACVDMFKLLNVSCITSYPVPTISSCIPSCSTFVTWFYT